MGWGRADSWPWSTHEAAATDAGLPLPELTILGLPERAKVTPTARDGVGAIRTAGGPLNGSHGASSCRHPLGIGYGGGTGGQGFEPWPDVVETWSEPAAAFHLLTSQFESRHDCTRASLLNLYDFTSEPATTTVLFHSV